MDFSVGDIVQMKKSPPCGSALWETLSPCIDLPITGTGSRHMVILPSAKFDKNVKKIIPKEQ